MISQARATSGRLRNSLRLCGALFVIACASGLRAADPAARAALEPKVTELVSLVSEGRIDAMLGRIGPIPDHERETFEQIRQHLSNIYSNAGKYSGFDIAGYKTLTSRYQ